MKTSTTLISQKYINQPLSMVGANAVLVGKVSRLIAVILPKCTNPVKKMTVKGVP
jgi:hypothetical protein